jgi:hypothetical protein
MSNLNSVQLEVLRKCRDNNLKISNKTDLSENKLTVNSITAKALVKLGFGLIQDERTVKRGKHLSFLVISPVGRDFVDALNIQPEPEVVAEEDDEELLNDIGSVDSPSGPEEVAEERDQEDSKGHSNKPWLVECVVCGEVGLRLAYNSDGTCGDYCKSINRRKDDEFAALEPLPELVDFSDLNLNEDEEEEVEGKPEPEVKTPPSKVELKAEIFWGKKWNGRYHEETPGEGCYVQLLETGVNKSFTGCPTGCGTSIEEALRDYYNRSKFEYLYGEYRLDMLEVVEEVDYRNMENEDEPSGEGMEKDTIQTHKIVQQQTKTKVNSGLQQCLGCGAMCNPHFLDAGYCGKRKCSSMRDRGVTANPGGIDPQEVLRQPRFQQANEEFKKEKAKLHVHIHLNRVSQPSMEGSEQIPTSREEFDAMPWSDWTRAMRNVLKCSQQKDESRFEYEERCWKNCVEYWAERGVEILQEEESEVEEEELVQGMEVAHVETEPVKNVSEVTKPKVEPERSKQVITQQKQKKVTERQAMINGVVAHLENLKDTLTQLGKKGMTDNLEGMVDVVGWFSDWILGLEPQDEEEAEEENEEEQVEEEVVKEEPKSLFIEVAEFLGDPTKQSIGGFKKMLMKVGLFDVDTSGTATMRPVLEKWLRDTASKLKPVTINNQSEPVNKPIKPMTKPVVPQPKKVRVESDSGPKTKSWSSKVLDTLSIISKFCGPKRGRCMLLDVSKYIGDLKVVQNHVYNMRMQGEESLVQCIKTEGRGPTSEEIWITPLGYRVLAEYEEAKKGEKKTEV